MDFRNPIPKDSLDDLPTEVKKNVLTLRGIQRLSKELPNLPDGRLRQSVEEDLVQLRDQCSSSEASLRFTIEKLNQEKTHLSSELKSLEQLLNRLENTSSSEVASHLSKLNRVSGLKWMIVGAIITLGLEYSIFKDHLLPTGRTIPEEKVVPSLKP